MTAVGVLGANGRMGRQLIAAVAADNNATLGAATVREGSSLLDLDAGVAVGIDAQHVNLATLASIDKSLDVLIDFTLPDAIETHLAWCQRTQTALVIGTTGYSEAQLNAIEQAAKHIPIIMAANYSVGVNLLIKLAQQTAKVMGDSADIEIIETHHRHKVDAPSGTALALGQGIADTLGRDLDTDAVYGREGHTGERAQSTIGFATVRGGDVVGDHTVLFADIGERIELTHKASSRMTFAQGAVRAAHWVCQQPPGLYSMFDVLGLNDV